MKYRTTLVLMIMALVAGCFIWIVEHKPGPSGPGVSEQPWLLNIALKRIDLISFYSNDTYIECVNERGQWFINQPIRDRADNGAINQMLADLTTLPQKDIITLLERDRRGLTLSDFGLAEPRARVVFEAGRQSGELMIGDMSPFQDAVYVRLDGEDTIITTSTDVLRLIPPRIDNIRNKQLLHGSPSYATRIEIGRRAKPMLVLEKEGAEWIIRRPVLARADWIKVFSLLDHLFSISIKEFISEIMGDPVVYGINDDDAMLKIGVWQLGQQAGEKVFFGKTVDANEDMVYANRYGSASVYSVDMDDVKPLFATAEDFRDSRLYFMAADQVRFIQVDKNHETLKLQINDRGGWDIIGPKRWPANDQAVSNLVNHINSLRIVAFIDGAVTNLNEFGLDEPSLVIRVAGHVPASGLNADNSEQVMTASSGSERVLRVSSVRSGDERVYAKYDDEQHAYQISASAAMTISVDPLKYKDSLVLALDSSDIRAITRKKRGVEETVARDIEDKWKPEVPEDGDVDHEAIYGILSGITALRASRFEVDDTSNLASYGLDDPRVVLIFWLIGERGIRKSLFIGTASDDQGVYAMLQGQNVVFVIEQEKSDLLERKLIR